MNIEINNKTRSRIDLALIKKVALKFSRYYKLEAKTVSIALVGDTAMRRLNKKFLKKDRPTDVLAFPDNNDYLGEIIIDYAQIKRQARNFSGNDAKKELVFILVHGLLHLLGYEDKTETGCAKMERLGKEFIKKEL